ATLGASVLAGLGADTIAGRSFQATDWRWLGCRLRTVALILAPVLGILFLIAAADPPRPPAPPEGPLSLREIRSFLRIPVAGARREALAARQVVSTPTFWLALTAIASVVALGRWRPERNALWARALGLIALAELGAYGHELLQVAPPAAFVGPDP